MARAKSEVVHIRELISARHGVGGVTISPAMAFRWQRRNTSEPGIKENVLQQAWVDTQGGVHWRDVPIVDEP